MVAILRNFKSVREEIESIAKVREQETKQAKKQSGGATGDRRSSDCGPGMLGPGSEAGALGVSAAELARMETAMAEQEKAMAERQGAMITGITKLQATLEAQQKEMAALQEKLGGGSAGAGGAGALHASAALCTTSCDGQ